MTKPLPRAGRGRKLSPEAEALVKESEAAYRAKSQPTPGQPPAEEATEEPVVVETGGSKQSRGEFGQVKPGVTQPEEGPVMTVGDEGRLVPSEDPSATLATPPQVDTSQTMESMLAARAELDVAQSHEDQRLQQEAAEEYTRRKGREDDSLQHLVERIEGGEPSGWDNAVDGLFGEGGEMHQALRAVEDATDGLITVPGAPGAGFGTPEYWKQVGWNALTAAAMEATIPLVVAGVPMAVRKGAYVLRTPKATRQAAGELRTAANEAHRATLQYQALRHPEVAGLRPQTAFGRPKGPVPTENLLQTTYRGKPVVATPLATTSRAARTGGAPMSAETSAAYQQMVSAHHNLARAVDKVDGLPAGWTLGSNRWMGLADDLMLHRGGTPVYYANPRLPNRLEKKWDLMPREVLQASPGRYGTTLENMPRPGTAMSSSQAAERLAPARQRMLDARAQHEDLVRMQRAERTARPRASSYRITDDFLQQSENKYRRAAQEYDDLIGASGRLSEGKEAAEGLRLLQTTLGKGKK